MALLGVRWECVVHVWRFLNKLQNGVVNLLLAGARGTGVVTSVLCRVHGSADSVLCLVALTRYEVHYVIHHVRYT